MRAVLLLSLLLCGCGELTGATEYSDAFFAPRDTGVVRDTAPRDASGTNALDGDYNGAPIPETRAAFLLINKSSPWLVFVSTDTKGDIPCETFKSADWNQRIPASAIVHGIQLTGTTVGTHTDVYAGRTTQTEAPLAWEKARTASLTLTRYNVIGAAGTFDLMFDSYIDDDPASDAGPIPEPVRGTFEVSACAVDW